MSTFYFDLGVLRLTPNGRVQLARGVSNPDFSRSGEKKRGEVPSWQKPYQLRDRWDRDGEKISVGGEARGINYAPWHLLNDQQRAERTARIEAVEREYEWESIKLAELPPEAFKSLEPKFEDALRRDGWPDDVDAFKTALEKGGF